MTTAPHRTADLVVELPPVGLAPGRLAPAVRRTAAPPASPGPFVSVVVTADPAAADLGPRLRRLEAALETEFAAHELVLVLVGAADEQVRAELTALVAGEANLQVLALASGRSEELAFTAGLDIALGDVVVIARLEVDPPDAVVRCAQLLVAHAPAVYGIDRRRTATWGQRRVLALGRALARRSLGVPVPTVSLGLAGFRRDVLTEWMARRDRDRVLRLLPAMTGGDYSVLPYDGEQRDRRSLESAGQVVRSLLHASARPLRLAVWLSVAVCAVNVVYALYVLVIGVFRGAVEGWVSLSLQASVMFFFLGVVAAVMAEYTYQSVTAASGSPLYRVSFEATSTRLGPREALNVEDDTAERR